MIKRFLYRTFCGFFLGISVFAPGFSGSMIAIIMGIYQDILRIVSNPFKEFKRNVIFCIPLGLGALISLVLFVISFKYLFETHEMATYILFVGLIAGNIPIVFNELKKCEFKKYYIISAIIPFAIALGLSLFSGGVKTADASETSNIIWGLSGLAAGASALIPGMSVSMILIITQVYGKLIFMAETLMHLNFAPIIPVIIFGVFALIGLVASSHGIKYVFKKFPGIANSAILGFMGGSLIGILIQSVQMQSSTSEWILSIAMLMAGLFISMLFVMLSKKFGETNEGESVANETST